MPLVHDKGPEMEGGEVTIVSIDSIRKAQVTAPWSDRNINRPGVPAEEDPYAHKRGQKPRQDQREAVCLSCTKITCDKGYCEIFPSKEKCRSPRGNAVSG